MCWTLVAGEKAVSKGYASKLLQSEEFVLRVIEVVQEEFVAIISECVPHLDGLERTTARCEYGVHVSHSVVTVATRFYQ